MFPSDDYSGSDMNAAQQAEVDKYIHIYGTQPEYKLGLTRGRYARDDLSKTVSRGSYLDVGCGRGEMLVYANDALKFKQVHGTETVPELYADDNKEFALVTELPFKDNSFDVVSCFDVLEHLLPDDTGLALSELNRVAKHSLLLTANNKPSNSLGVELHINRREYAEWNMLIRQFCAGNVQWLQGDNISETWLINYD